ncbi:MAG: ABC transporter permease [Rhodocyclaceae bacterium]|nr:ABC transporter permease [Rhodocyclaceae bacterium]
MLNDRILPVFLHAKLALRNLFRQRKRTALALSTVAGGVIAFLLAGGFFNWILETMEETTIHSQLGHFQVTRPGYFEKGLSDPYGYLLPEPEPLPDPSRPAVVTITPRLAFTGLLSKGDETISFIGEGIDPVREKPITRAILIVKGKDLTEADGSSVLLGEGLAANLAADVGDTVVLLATTAKGGVNGLEAQVAGIFHTANKGYDATALRAPIPLARELMGVAGATSWVVLLADGSDMPTEHAALARTFDAHDFEITPWTKLADFYNKTVELFSKQVGVVRTLIALIVILSISNTLSMSVFERTTEIGTSMALGVRRRGVLGLFVMEGALIGVLGGTLGVAIGLLLGELISLIGIPMPPAPGMSHGYTGRIAISPELALDGFQLAFATTILASIFPSWKASRMNIVDALRHQR